MPLEERKWRILRTIIDDYIVTATPVGSRAISKHPDIALSSATIRNEMSDLEEMGYLDQPHTSAGRIPSDKAYRLYVDQMMQTARLSDADMATVRQVINARIDQAGELIAQAAKLLSKLTNYPSAILAPSIAPSAIRHVQLVPVSDGRALAVIVSDAGVIHDAMMRIPTGFGAEELERYSRLLTNRLQGHSLGEAHAILEAGMDGELRQHRSFFDQVADAIQRNANATVKRAVALGGTANLFLHPEFNDLKSARSMLNVLETEEIMLKLLESAKHSMQISITIGSENTFDEMKGASIVTATYRIGTNPVGSFGVIGPTRMDYPRVVAVLDYVGRSLSEILTAGTHQNRDKLDTT